MTIVVDASGLVAALVDAGPEGRWAEAALAEESLAAPELLLADASNILRQLERAGDISRIEATGSHGDLWTPAADASNILRQLERAGDISRIEATGSHGDLWSLDVDLAPFAPFAARVWALRGDLASYDAWHVALAEALDCPLVTLDRRLVRAAGPHCEIVVPHASGTTGVRLLTRPAAARRAVSRPPPEAHGPV